MFKDEIDINNEEQIFNECDFDFFYNCDLCSAELCKFYNDILQFGDMFDKKQAIIDLGRIAITLNNKVRLVEELNEILKKYGG